MEHYPATHKEFLLWAEKISRKLEQSTNGEVRIGKNKLAAVMAKELPNSPYAFNINTLKNLFDLESLKTEQPLFSALLIDRILKIFTGPFDVKSAFSHRAKNPDTTVYHLLDCDGAVGDFFHQLPKLNDGDLSLISKKLPAFYVDDIVTELGGQNWSFEEKIKSAFNELTKDFTLVYLDALSDFYNEHSSLLENCDNSHFNNRSFHALNLANLENPDNWFSDLLSSIFKKSLNHSLVTYRCDK